MFTGIIQFTGTVKRFDRGGPIAQLEVDADGDLSDVRIGDSVAVSGVCLTVVAIASRKFRVEVSAETLERSTLGYLRVGEAVNLEQALRLNDFLGGHLVLGHVDGVGVVRERVERPGSLRIGIEISRPMMRYVVEKGSVAVDGISLTVNRCVEAVFYVHMIPHTVMRTTLGQKKVGERVNIETDIIGKYIEKLMKRDAGIDGNFLVKHGF